MKHGYRPGEGRIPGAIRGAIGLLFLGTVIAAAGCQRIGRLGRQQADREAASIIAQKQIQALGETKPFSIEADHDAATQQLLAETPRLDWSRDDVTTPARLLSLGETLALALVNNREYQSRKEALFSQALGLSNTRYDFGSLFSASGSAELTRTADELGVERFGQYGLAAGWQRLAATGARITLNVTHDWLRFLTGAPRSNASNALTFGLVQPLLREAGPLSTLEPLRQGERSMVYAVREFQRYQQAFVIQVVQRFYGLLSAQDQLRNAATNMASAREDLRKLEAMSGGSRGRPDIEIDQARQRVLEAESGVISSRNDFNGQLDQFKLFLGLPLDLDLAPDTAELTRIQERGLLRPRMDLPQAIRIAQAERLDFQTVRDRLADSERLLELALRDFLPRLDLSYQYSTSKQIEEDRFRLEPRFNTQSFGLNLDLPLDWTPRRNAYRRALIDVAQAARDTDEQRDNLTLEVRDAWRRLEELRTQYGIQQESVRLAERRVESSRLLLQMGRATARDLLEAQDSLLASRNALTSALINHTISRLQFWNAIERLNIDANGSWNEPEN